MDKNVTSNSVNMGDMQICAYACPPTEFNPNPFEFKFDQSQSAGTMTIQEYKQKIVELFIKMEQEHGCCHSFRIEHTGQFDTDSTGKMTDIKCIIEY